MVDYPLVFRLRQQPPAPPIANVPDEVENQLSQLALENKIQPGQSVAIGVGSRGIANLKFIVKAIVAHLKRLEAQPFIVPAMGSHGGGTAAGQQEILESYGVTESFCGCPIRAGMKTVIVCQVSEGFPVHFAAEAYAADHVVVCNRIKTHTQFVGDVESGLMKMMLIGLGKQEGAKVYHRAIKDYSFGQIVRRVTAEVLKKCSIVAGVGIVENGACQTALIEAVSPEQLVEREQALLTQAKQWMARLPFNLADILLIDEIGKNISGTGFDSSLVGRKYLVHQAADQEYPKIKMIALRDLTEQSHGNAEGAGLAEFCRTRLLEKKDVQVTRVNAVTSGHLSGAMVPLDYPTDQEMVEVMLGQIGLRAPADAKLMWIRNTRELSEVECSAAYLPEARERDDLTILSDLRPLHFDASGNLSDQHMNATT
ncbi:MAG: [Fe-S]-binding protein [Planctomycetaceae bacterium]|jgi:hypothetical protein|nr:[Fe-S]-binding protein [Planctomycetaceae bacterium]MBP61956.1 [Fe-S]-binding protein [Planctomycetaceae bacterium]